MESPVVQALILGVLQGLTEFLPVSSSGHLALAQKLIPGFRQPGLLLDVALHVGTLAAILAYFRRELLRVAWIPIRALRPGQERDPEDLALLLGIVVACVPTAVIGLLLEDWVEGMFESMAGVGAALMVTGLMLVAGEALGRRVAPRPGNPRAWPSFLIGVAQGVAVVPGISRSGATISTARALGISGEAAARFSFLASIPAVAGAALLSAIKEADAVGSFGPAEVLAYIIGPLAAAAVGFAAIEAVMRLVTAGRLRWFSLYCLALGGAAVAAGLFWSPGG